MSNINDFLHTLKGKINSFISGIIEYSDDKVKKPLDDIKFPFIKKRNISASKIKSPTTLKSYLRNYFPEMSTHTFDYLEGLYLPKRNNTFDKSKNIYKEIHLPKNFLGKKTDRKNATFDIKEFSKSNVNNMHKISTINTSKEKVIKNYTEKKVEPKYYKRNDNKMQNIKINYDNLKKSESKNYKKSYIIEKNENYIEKVNDNDNANIDTKKIFMSEIKMTENKELNNNDIHSDIENENINENEKSDEIIVKEKEIDFNIYDSFLSHRNNKYNSFISLNNSRVFNNELVKDNPQSFSLNLSEIKKNDNQKLNFICQKQNEFSYKISNDKNDENQEINFKKDIKEKKSNEEIKIEPKNDILEKKTTVKFLFENKTTDNNKTLNLFNSVNKTNIFTKEKNSSSINQNSLTNKTKDSTLFKENKNGSLFGEKIEKSEKKINLFGAEENSGSFGSNSLFNLNSQNSGTKKDKMNNNEDKGGLFGNLNNSGNNLSLFGNNLNNKNALFGSSDGNKILFGKVENGNSNNKSLFG